MTSTHRSRFEFICAVLESYSRAIFAKNIQISDDERSTRPGTNGIFGVDAKCLFPGTDKEWWELIRFYLTDGKSAKKRIRILDDKYFSILVKEGFYNGE